MAKYLKENQIKAGITIYVTHPKFNGIECKFITSKPVLDFTFGSRFKKFKYKPVQCYSIDSKGVNPTGNLYNFNGKWEDRTGYCGDDGIPDKNGKFSYQQERRAFSTLKKAKEYWMSQQTPENLKRWQLEREEFFAWEL